MDKPPPPLHLFRVQFFLVISDNASCAKGVAMRKRRRRKRRKLGRRRRRRRQSVELGTEGRNCATEDDVTVPEHNNRQFS